MVRVSGAIVLYPIELNQTNNPKLVIATKIPPSLISLTKGMVDPRLTNNNSNVWKSNGNAENSSGIIFYSLYLLLKDLLTGCLFL